MPFNPLSSLTGTNATGSGRVQSAIAFASQKTGVDFSYLLGQARLESGLKADAKASTSSAQGLYQFVEQSWLGVVKQHGSEYGLGWAADAIHAGANGRLTVSDPGTRRAILALRNDPATASLMAAEHASDNGDAIKSSLGRDATSTDLYMAHFLGLGGARSFLTAMDRNPGRSGASMFPAAARANHSVFYTSNGTARSLSQIYDRLGAKLNAGSDTTGPTGTSDTTTPLPAIPSMLASTLLGASGDEVIPGSGETSTSDAAMWAHATLDRLNGASATTTATSLLRPTPNTARLAYMLLASMGG
jgi:hypothetical protein